MSGAVSPSYSALCRNPITFRWNGTLKWYERYRINVRLNSNEAGVQNLLTSPQLTDTTWQAGLPEKMTAGGVEYEVYGQIEWQVLVQDARTGQTVNSSTWFHFFFSTLAGLPCL